MMSPEEVEHTMQFLLAQQAQFAVDLDTLGGEVRQVTGAVLSLTGIVGQGAERQAVTEQRMAELAVAQRELTEAQRRTDEHLKMVEDHLNAVIVMFERHIQENHGPRPS